MTAIYIYILKSILLSGVLLGYYWIALRNTRFHYYNRFFLIATVLMSLSLPAIDFNWYTISEPDSATAKQILIMLDQPQNLNSSSLLFSYEYVFFYLSFIISVSLIIYLLSGIYKLYKIKLSSKVTQMEKFDFIETSNEDAPFSFMRNLFWRQDISMEDETGKHIFRHELAHIEQLHSYDKLMINFLTAIFWMNPFMWIIRKELEVIHEFIADEKSVENADASSLAAMILKMHYQSPSILSGQSFFYTSIKRRLFMLTSSKKTSYSYLRRLIVLPLGLGAIAMLSFTLKEEDKGTINEEQVNIGVSVTQANEQADTVPTSANLKSAKLKLVSVDTSKIGNAVIIVDGKEVDRSVIDQLEPSQIKMINIKKNGPSGTIGDSSKKAYIMITTTNDDKNNSPSETVVFEKEMKIKIDTIHFVPVIEGSWVKTNDEDVSIVSPDKVIMIESDKKKVIKYKQIKERSRKTEADKTLAAPTVVMIKKLNELSEKQQVNNGKSKTAIAISEINFNSVDSENDSKSTGLLTSENILMYIDGKKSGSDEMKKISPDQIKSINIIRGEAAVSKYGEEARAGVMEITTKK